MTRINRWWVKGFEAGSLRNAAIAAAYATAIFASLLAGVTRKGDAWLTRTMVAILETIAGAAVWGSIAFLLRGAALCLREAFAQAGRLADEFSPAEPMRRLEPDDGRRGGLEALEASYRHTLSCTESTPPVGKEAPVNPRIASKSIRGGSLHGPLIGRACLCMLAFASLSLQAQHYPERPVRIIVGYPPGAPVDTVARIVSEKLTARWDQPVVVENRTGANGIIGTEAVANALPDGHTVLFTPPSLVINPLLYPKLPFDSSQFVPVTLIAAFPNILVVHPKVSAANVQELIAFARANPDKLNYASPGSGSSPHLTAELFKMMAGGLRITHVPYKGGGPMLTALLAGEVEMMFFNPAGVLPYIRAGRLKALAVLSERRIASLPDVPAMSEVLPGLVSVTWWGAVAPPKTPMPIAEKLSAAIAEALKQPDVAKRLADLSADPIGNSPAEMAAFLKEEAGRWGGIIHSVGVKLD